MSDEGPVECVECGLSLGTGLPGAMTPCARCGRWVATRRGSSNVGGALLVAGLAIGGGLLIAAVLRRIFGRE